MDASKIRGGQMIAAIGGIVLLISLFFLDWYKIGGVVGQFASAFGAGSFGAWDGEGFTGTIANLVILAAGVVAIGLAISAAASRTVALPVAASSLTAGLGIGAVGMVLLRMLFQPGPNKIVDLKFGIYLALIAAIVVAIGGWQSMQEEGATFEQAGDQLRERFGGGGGPQSPGGSSEAPPPGPSQGPPTS